MIDKKIKALREHNNYTQDDLAIACNVTRSAISNWENARREPSHDKLKIIACVFDVTIEELLNDDISVEDIFKRKEPHTIIYNANFSDDQTIKSNKKISSMVHKMNFVLTLIVTVCLLVILIPAIRDNRFYSSDEKITNVETVTLQLKNKSETFEYAMEEDKKLENISSKSYYKVIVDTKPIFDSSDDYYFVEFIEINIIINGTKKLNKILLIDADDNYLYYNEFYRLQLSEAEIYCFVFYYETTDYYIGAFIA